MTEIRKAKASDLPAILPLLKEFDNPNLNEQDWKNFFTKHWPIDEDYFGFMVIDQDQVVGFLGGIFSSRIINDKVEKFCNLSTWIVKEHYRGQSLALLFKYLNQKDITFTDLTANKVAKILRRLGFSDIDDQLHVILPLPGLNLFTGKVKVIRNFEEIEDVLNYKEKQIFSHHKAQKCSHALLRSAAGSCYVIYDIVYKKRLPVARVHFLSDPQFFKDNIQAACLSFCSKATIFGILVGDHYLGEKRLPLGMMIPQRQSVLFKSETLKREDMDTIYSELQILGLRN